jgi:hypothetical protein
VVVLAVSAVGTLRSPSASSPRDGGTELWARRYSGFDRDSATDVVVSPDGSKVFVTGYSLGGGGKARDFATVAYDASTGATLWIARYDGGEGDDEPAAIAVSPDGLTVFVAGYTTSQRDWATIAYVASSGVVRWVRRYDGPGFSSADYPTAIAVGSDGSRVFVVGASVGDATGNDYTTIAYDALTGDVRWARRYDGLGSPSADGADAVVFSPDGSAVFVTGTSQGPLGDLDFVTIAYEAGTGSTSWVRRFDGGAGHADDARAMSISPDGSAVFVTGGSSLGGTDNSDYATIAYDAVTGGQRWFRSYDGTGNGSDVPVGIVSGDDGASVYVAGSSVGLSGEYEYATIAYDAASGTPRWVRRYDSPGDGSAFPNAIAAGSDGHGVFVTGSSSGSNGWDYATVAYDATTGATSWVRAYIGPVRADKAHSIAASPDGSAVFVTGDSQGGTGGDNDYLTIAYVP